MKADLCSEIEEGTVYPGGWGGDGQRGRRMEGGEGLFGRGSTMGMESGMMGGRGDGYFGGTNAGPMKKFAG